MLEETKVMARLLDDLQTLATAEAGALRLHRERVDPAQLVGDAVAAFGPSADAADVRIDSRAPEGLPALDVDPIHGCRGETGSWPEQSWRFQYYRERPRRKSG